MKLSHAMTLVGLGVSATALALAQGCSSSSSGGTAPTPTTDGGMDATAPLVGQPPSKPTSGTTPATSVEQNYALKQLFLGDTDLAGVMSNAAWMKFGYNIDGKVSTASSTDVCKLAAGAPKSTQLDGDNGIDNSFGHNIVPIITTTAGTDAPAKINASIQQGAFTVMIDVTGFDDNSTTQTSTGLTGFLNAGANFDPSGATHPTFTTADNWPVARTLLSDPSNAKSSTVKFPDAYIVNGTFVNGSPGTVKLNLEIGGQSLTVTVNQAVITFDHKAKGQATNGVIAGVINTEDLITQLKGVAGHISTSLCSGQAFDSIAQQIRQASDILSDGTNDPSKSCDGISIGLGFTAAQIGLPQTVAPVATPAPDPCSDAGAPPTDGGGPQDAAGGG